MTGVDRAGLIAAISEILAQEGADIEDVSMTRLSGNFAMIMVARGGDGDRLEGRLCKVGRDLDLFVHIGPAVEDPQRQESEVFVSAAGPNRVGIVASLSRALSLHGANITEMTTCLLEKTNIPVYMVRLEATMPDDLVELEKDLASVAAATGVEVRLERMERVDL